MSEIGNNCDFVILPLHIEIAQKRTSCASKEYVKELVQSYICKFGTVTPGATLSGEDLEDSTDLAQHVQAITFCDVDYEDEVNVSSMALAMHVFKLDSFGPENDTMTDGSSGEELSAADSWALPSEEFHGLWESLIYDSSLKRDVLRFVETAFEFAERGVDPNIVGCNRVVLLHGPPGTGKTSLCRALANKLAVRLGDRFPRARLLEINAHGLFSKWFSESGKLVAKLFERIREVADDRRLLAIVLIDEAESLTHARRASLGGLEPSDSVRAVNAVLRELDRLRRRPNALVLATSNVPGLVDAALLDRADVRRLVPAPGARAAHEVLRRCLAELMTRGAVAPPEALFPARVLAAARWAEGAGSAASLRLWEVAQKAAAHSVSGRALRRLPLLARARLPPAPAPPPSLSIALVALSSALDDYLTEEDELEKDWLQRPNHAP